MFLFRISTYVKMKAWHLTSRLRCLSEPIYPSEGRCRAYVRAVDNLENLPNLLADPAPSAAHQVSTHGRFLPLRGGGGAAERRPALIHRRDSAGSITSSISKWDAVFTAFP